MSELRWNPLLEEWVTVAPWRQDRTYHPPAEHCPLCPTRPGEPETEIPEPDYHIVVFENRFPSYTGDQGRAEVVCYTPDHDSSLGEQSVDHIRDLIEVWRDRTSELGRLPNVRYVYVFENRGEEIGVTLSHPHGQIYAYPFIPPVIQRELAAEARHTRKTDGVSTATSSRARTAMSAPCFATSVGSPSYRPLRAGRMRSTSPRSNTEAVSPTSMKRTMSRSQAT